MSLEHARTLSLGTLVVGLALSACAPPPAQAPEPLIADPPPGAAEGASAGEAASELSRGVAYAKSEHYAEAKPHLEKALAAQPTSTEAAFYLGLSAEKTSDKASAEAYYKKALAIDPGFAEAAENLGALYLDEPPRPDEAIQVLSSTLAKAPGAVHLMVNLAYAYSLKGDFANASKQYEAALAKGEDAGLRFRYGQLLVEAKQPEKAGEQLRKALAGTKDDAPTLATIGRLLAFSKSFGDCVKAFDRAIALKPGDPEWFVRRGTCRHELKDEPGAKADFEAAIKADPKFAAAHYYLGVSYLSEGRRQTAYDELEKAVKLGEGTPIAKVASERLDQLGDIAGARGKGRGKKK
jgi:Tfp pilus assembly protein PilF